MPLGLKNAPAIFQRKMQNIFNENQEFILVYIDDLLVFSKTYKEHIAHLEIFFRKVEQNGLILSILFFNWYRDIKSKRDIEKIIQRLEDIQILSLKKELMNMSLVRI